MMFRRNFFEWVSQGIASTAFISLLMKDRILASDSSIQGSLTRLHSAPKAKRVIHIVACGGVSQIDTFDYKPELEKQHGKSLGGDRPDVFFGKVGLLRKSDWEFRQRGQSGLWISELFPNLAKVADELTFIRSMMSETSNHTPATFQENSGFRLNGFPVFGAWASYGLGSETQDLPAFVVIPDARGVPAGGSINWTNGFLPAQHQGVVIRSQGTPIEDLFQAGIVDSGRDTDMRQLLSQLNDRHRSSRMDDDLAARMRSYELAARMQRVVPEVTDLNLETQRTQEQYGIGATQTNDFGRACLLSRRLLESGVRFVQIFSGGAFGSPRINWDGHEDMMQNHSQEAGRIDLPIAGLISDLRQRGMLNDTLILFTSEFGRTPFTQSDDNVVGKGRDHNQFGFTVWMAGAGLRAGTAYGATDELGMRSVEQIVRWPDFHATILHLLGVDHEQLTYYHNGIQRRLTDVSGSIIRGILA